jgi:hypothetical protein
MILVTVIMNVGVVALWPFVEELAETFVAKRDKVVEQV